MRAVVRDDDHAAAAASPAASNSIDRAEHHAHRLTPAAMALLPPASEVSKFRIQTSSRCARWSTFSSPSLVSVSPCSDGGCRWRRHRSSTRRCRPFARSSHRLDARPAATPPLPSATTRSSRSCATTRRPCPSSVSLQAGVARARRRLAAPVHDVCAHVPPPQQPHVAHRRAAQGRAPVRGQRV
ncbi:hypothetical protein FGB62_178g042 [Gracilaria domingensis]|nr:hypothetical protein FGB62_178g042 [Gracilaria domingensis]